MRTKKGGFRPLRPLFRLHCAGMRRLLPELSALASAALIAALAMGRLAHAATTADPAAVDPTDLRASDEPPPPSLPSALLLLAQPPHEVSFVLDGPQNPAFPLLLGFRDASIERQGPMRLYLSGRWGRWAAKPWNTFAWQPMLSPGDDAAAEAAAMGDVVAMRSKGPGEPWADGLVDLGGAEDLAPVAAAARDRAWMAQTSIARGAWSAVSPLFDSSGPGIHSNGFDALYLLPPDKPVRDWRCQRRPVSIVRYGAESDALELVKCDGSMQPGALDRLSILARPPEVPRPEALPDEPDAEAWSTRHEWLPNVRVVHPRLVWALQQLADAFPRRAVYVFSGYRPMARVGGGRMDDGESEAVGHRSLHADGRALDLSVQGVPNEEVLKACRKLADVGCGFYPSSKFVHVDVRHARTGKAFWIDASAPGEPSRYVDSWPGVVDSGAMSWVPEAARVKP